MSGVDAASQRALEFCRRHPGWQRFCDIQDTNALMVTWEELPTRYRAAWEREYPCCAEEAWREFGHRPTRHRRGFVDEHGEFHDTVSGIRLNIMTVVETGGPEGVYFWGGRNVKPERIRKPVKAKAS